VEWEAHVRAAIVDGVDAAVVDEQADGLPTDADDEAAGLLQLGEGRGAQPLSGLHNGHSDRLHQ
jgi:hypothetical protein